MSVVGISDESLLPAELQYCVCIEPIGHMQNEETQREFHREVYTSILRKNTGIRERCSKGSWLLEADKPEPCISATTAWWVGPLVWLVEMSQILTEDAPVMEQERFADRDGGDRARQGPLARGSWSATTLPSSPTFSSSISSSVLSDEAQDPYDGPSEPEESQLSAQCSPPLV